MKTKQSVDFVQRMNREAAAQRSLALALDKAIQIFGAQRLANTLSSYKQKA